MFHLYVYTKPVIRFNILNQSINHREMFTSLHSRAPSHLKSLFNLNVERNLKKTNFSAKILSRIYRRKKFNQNYEETYEEKPADLSERKLRI